MTAWMETLAAVATVSALPLAGILAFASDAARLRALLPSLVPLAVGALAGAATLHLIPEAVHRDLSVERVGLLVVVGLAGFYFVDRAMHARTLANGSGATASWSSTALRPPPREARARELIPLALAGDALHNVIDGVLMASAFLDAPTLGILTGAAIAVHELPRELATFALLLRGGVSVQRAVMFNVLTAIGAAGGAVVTLVVGTRVAGVTAYLLPVAAGNFLYLAVTMAVSESRGAPVRQMVTLAALAAAGFTVAAFGGHAG